MMGAGFLLAGVFFGSFFALNSIEFPEYLFPVLPALAAFGFAFLNHSLAYFPEANSFSRKSKAFVIPHYVFAVVAVLISILATVVFKKSFLIRAIVFYVSYALPIHLAFLIINYAVFKKKRGGEFVRAFRPARNGAYFILIVWALAEAVRWVFSFAANEIVIASFLILPFSFLRAVSKARFLNIRLRLRKNYQYYFSMGLSHAFYAAVFVLGIAFIARLKPVFPNLHFTGSNIEVLKNPLSPEKLELYRRVFAAAAVLAEFCLVAWAAIKTKRFLKKKFYREEFDYRKAASEFSKITSRNWDLKSLASIFLAEINDQMKLKTAGVCFYRGGEGAALRANAKKDDKFPEFCEAFLSKIENALKLSSGAVKVSVFPRPIGETFAAYGFEYAFPIKKDGAVYGCAFLGEKKSEEPFKREDWEFCELIAEQITVAAENAYLYSELASRERMKRELELAREIQLASLPKASPNREGVDISAISVPAYEVGGDFYDFYEDEKSVYAVIGDASGKGASAAIFMSITQGVLRALNEFDLSPKNLLSKANKLIFKYLEKRSFISAAFAKIDLEKKVATVARAGHIPPLYYDSASEEIKELKTRGLALGIANDEKFESILEEVSFEIKKGDVILLTTDGATDARSPEGEEFSFSRVKIAFKSLAEKSAAEIMEGILSEIKSFSKGTKAADDLTIAVIKIS